MAGMTSLTPPSSKLNFLYDNEVKSQFSDQTVACACIIRPFQHRSMQKFSVVQKHEPQQRHQYRI